MKLTHLKSVMVTLCLAAGGAGTLAVVASSSPGSVSDGAPTPAASTTATGELAASLGILNSQGPAELPEPVRTALSGGATSYGVNPSEARAVPSHTGLYVVPGSEGVCLASGGMVTCAPTDQFLKGRALSLVMQESDTPKPPFTAGVQERKPSVSSAVLMGVMPDNVRRVKVRSKAGAVIAAASVTGNFFEVDLGVDPADVGTIELGQADGTTASVDL
jgi:hypothetical protein